MGVWCSSSVPDDTFVVHFILENYSSQITVVIVTIILALLHHSCNTTLKTEGITVMSQITFISTVAMHGHKNTLVYYFPG